MAGRGAARGLTPTAEQEAIRAYALANPGVGIKIEAGAGAAKTTTLEMLACDSQVPGIYLAFNRPVKQEAEGRFPRHMTVKTAHGAAFGALGMHDQSHRLQKRLFGDGVRQLVRLPRCRMPDDALGTVVLDTVGRYCNSADRDISMAHVALDPGEPEDVRMAAYEGARALWGRLSDRRDDCPITHDTYLKIWALGDARLRGFGRIFFDEAQDASPVMIDVVLRQGLPVTWVGDSSQQIYSWRGAVNAMRGVGGQTFTLSQSFRFGQSVADAANAVLSCKPDGTRPDFSIVGNPARVSQIGRVPRDARHAFLSRTNAEWFARAMASTGTVHVIGGLEETARLLDGAWGLWRHGTRPARVPAIARFASWRTLCEHAERFDDRELMFARRIVEQYREGLPAAIAGLRARHVEHEGDAQLILSTAHKAKGREFGLVTLGAGFSSPLDEEWAKMGPAAREAELNLLYVALTRAMHGLEPCQAVLDCVAIQRGLARPAANGQPAVQAPPARLPEIRTERPAPPVVEPEEEPAEAVQATTPAAARAWSAAEDAEALRMDAEAFPSEDIAGWLDRPAAAVAVRVALLKAAGGDPSLVAEIVAALGEHAPDPKPRRRPRKAGTQQADGQPAADAAEEDRMEALARLGGPGSRP